MEKGRISIADIEAKKGKEKIVALTAYSFPIAKIIDEYVDIVLVGDSLGMVVYGMNSTLEVTMDMMVNHTKAVARAVKNALIVADLPFGSYQESKSKAFKNASALLKAGADAVKLEGGVAMEETIGFLSQRGIPVMGHVGLQPQHIKNYGGYKYQGKTKEEHKNILRDALSVQKAGAFSLVIEAVPEILGKEVVKALHIPVIGIGAAKECDGQVLVVDDILGLNQEFTPRFARKYLNLHEEISKAVANFAADVRKEKFPASENLLKTKSK